MREKWKRWGLELAIVLLAVLALRFYQTRSHLSGPLPRLEARDVGGQKRVLGGPRAEPMVLHFWATWCGVCRAEEGNVVAASKQVQVISVASRSGPRGAVADYAKQHGISYPVINDAQGELAKRFGVRAYPTTFFIDRNGQITTSEVGYTTYLGLLLRAYWAGI